MKNTSKSSSNASALDRAVEGFLESRRVDAGAADKTIEAYRRDLLQLSAWLSTKSVNCVSETDL
ncbi:MAG TPA: hypothetical protein DCS07_12675, partial [Bdellovibrionales bacterium]|nr:hypothetical protein [Bdellovibrionales bacterium]